MIPEDLLYTEAHQWIELNDDIATVGITDFAQDELGNIVSVALPEFDAVEAYDVLGELESTKAVSEIYAPVPGVVVAVNESLESNPEVMNSDPYGEGWLVKIRVDDAGAVSDLLAPEEYEALIGK